MNTRNELVPPPEDVEIIRIQHPTTLLSGNSAPPSNEQIIGAVESTKKVLEEQIEKNAQLDETGKKIAEAADKVLQTTEDLIQHKNRDQKIQKFLQHVYDFGKKFKEEAQRQKNYSQVEGDVQQGIERFKKLGEHIRNLLRELVTSSEFKSLVAEMVDLFEKIFSKFSKKVNLTDKAKEALDETSSEVKKGISGGKNENAADAAKEKTEETGEGIKESVKEKTGEVKEALREKSNEGVKETAKEKAQEAGDEIKEKAGEVKEKVQEHSENIKETVKEKAKETGKEIKEAAKETADETKEDREKLNHSVRKFLSKVGSNEQYKKLSQDFFSLWDFLHEKKEELEHNEAKERLRQEFIVLYNEASSVVCEFVGKEDIKDIEKRFWDFYGQITEDEKIRNYFRDLRKWAQKLIDEPNSFEQQEIIDTAQDFIDRGAELFKGKPEEALREILDDFKSMLRTLQEDKYALALKESFQEVQEAFEGSIFQALSQTRVLAIPILKELMNEIPLPKIIGRTSDTAYTIDNLVLQGREITLDDITFEINFGMKEVMELTIKINKIQGTLRSAHFTYLSSGLFDWEDEGTFTCQLSAPRWKLKWIIQESNNQPLRLRLVKVDGTIDKLDITIEEAKHKFLDRVSLALFSGEIKRKTSVVAENALRHQAQLLTQKFNEFFLQKHFYSGSSDASPRAESFEFSQSESKQPLDTVPLAPLL